MRRSAGGGIIVKSAVAALVDKGHASRGTGHQVRGGAGRLLRICLSHDVTLIRAHSVTDLDAFAGIEPAFGKLKLKNEGLTLPSPMLPSTVTDTRLVRYGAHLARSSDDPGSRSDACAHPRPEAAAEKSEPVLWRELPAVPIAA